MSITRIAVAVLIGYLFVPNGVIAGEPAIRKTTAAAVVDVIKTNRRLKFDVAPSVSQSDSFADHDEAVAELLRLLDNQSSRRDIAIIVSLTSYYLGEAPGSLLSCLIMRKGKPAIPLVSMAKASGSSACQKETPQRLVSKVCLSPQELNANLDSLLTALRSGERCPLP